MTFEFDGFQELYDFLTTGGKEIKNDFIPEFKRHVGNINKGCKCKKKERIGKAVQAYTRLVHKLNKENEFGIKDELEAKTIRFLYKGDLVRQF